MTKRDEITEILEELSILDYIEEDTIDKILEICNRPRSLNSEKYKKQVNKNGIQFTDFEFREHFKFIRNIFESDIWAEEE